MTADHGERPGNPPAPHPAPRADPPDAAHLDEDPEAMEDPVHCGDARHQHELRSGSRPPAG